MTEDNKPAGKVNEPNKIEAFDNARIEAAKINHEVAKAGENVVKRMDKVQAMEQGLKTTKVTETGTRHGKQQSGQERGM